MYTSGVEESTLSAARMSLEVVPLVLLVGGDIAEVTRTRLEWVDAERAMSFTASILSPVPMLVPPNLAMIFCID